MRVAVLTAAGDARVRGRRRPAGHRQRPHRPVHRARSSTAGSCAREAFWAITDCAVPVIGAINGPAHRRRASRWPRCCDILVRRRERHVRHDRDQRRAARGERAPLAAGRPAQGPRAVLHRRADQSAEELHRLGAIARGGAAGRPAWPRPARWPASLAAQEPDRAAAGQGVDEPRRVPPAQGRLPHRAGLHRPPARLRGRAEARAAFLEKRDPDWKWR